MTPETVATFPLCSGVRGSHVAGSQAEEGDPSEAGRVQASFCHMSWDEPEQMVVGCHPHGCYLKQSRSPEGLGASLPSEQPGNITGYFNRAWGDQQKGQPHAGLGDMSGICLSFSK